MTKGELSKHFDVCRWCGLMPCECKPSGDVTLTREEAEALMETLRLSSNFAFDERQHGLADETTAAFELLESKLSAANEKRCEKCAEANGDLKPTFKQQLKKAIE